MNKLSKKLALRAANDTSRIRDMLPLYAYFYFDIEDPPIPYDSLVHIHPNLDSPNLQHLDATRIMSSLVSLLYLYWSPLNSVLNTYRSKHSHATIATFYARRPPFTNIRVNTDTSVLMPSLQPLPVRIIQASNFARSLRIRAPCPPTPVCFTTQGISMSLHPDGQFIMSIDCEDGNQHTFSLDVPSVLSATQLWPASYTTVPTHFIRDSKLSKFRSLQALFTAIWPLVLNSDAPAPTHLPTTSVFGHNSNLSPSDYARIPISIYTLVIQKALALPTLPIAHPTPTPSYETCFSFVYEPVIRRDDHDIIMVQMNINISKMIRALKSHPSKPPDPSEHLSLFSHLMNLPNELLEQVLAYFYDKFWFDCPCIKRSSRRPPSSRTHLPSSSFIVTPLGSTRFFRPTTGDLIISHVIHLTDNSHRYQPPITPSYLEGQTSPTQAITGCPCHLNISLYTPDEINLSSSPQPYRRILDHLVSDTLDPRLKITCTCQSSPPATNPTSQTSPTSSTASFHTATY
jgi:hypothetical protein